MNNIFQQAITPVTPKVLPNERLYVYVPKASTSNQGIASFNSEDFGVNNGQVRLIWPMKMDIEQLGNPLTNISRIKLLPDEFEATGNTSSIINPITGEGYNNTTSELKLLRTNRNAFIRPELVMLDNTSDFETTLTGDNYLKYTLKRNNPLLEPSLVKVNNVDFVRDVTGTVKLNWPLAYIGNDIANNTDGFGLMRISSNSLGGLKYEDNGDLAVDILKVNKVKPTYGANTSSGFIDYNNYVDAQGYAKVDSNNYPKLALTKEAVGLSNVENKAFSEYTYSDFGANMQNTLDNKFLDKITWNNLFSDWQPPVPAKNTPQKWFTILDEEDNSLRESIRSLQRFLGYFEDLTSLLEIYPSPAAVYGSTAFLLDTNTYWAVRKTGDIYEWYDTHIDSGDITELMEVDATVFRADGIPSAGVSGKWAQSDHIHPTDTTRLATTTYNSTNITLNSTYSNDPDNFVIKLNDTTPSTLSTNIPYVRKAKCLHNYKGQTDFIDSESSEEYYWAGDNDDFLNEVENIRDNTLCVVDDGENTIVDKLVSAGQLDNQGISVDVLSTERFVTINTTTRPNSTKVLGLASDDLEDRYKVVDYFTANGLTTPGTYLMPVVNPDGSISTLNVANNHVMVGDSSNGTNLDSNIHKDALLVTSRNGYNTALTPYKLLQSGQDNTVSTINLSSTANNLILTNGEGSIQETNIASDRLVVSGVNGITASTYNSNNVLLSSNSATNTNIATGSILVSNGTNIVEGLTSANGKRTMLAGDTFGGWAPRTFTPGKYVYTNQDGDLVELPMTTLDAGKTLGVDQLGEPTLLSRVIVPTTLPITTYSTEPGTNSNGLVIARLNEDPGAYSDGVLYMW